jgi:hypothetical protein
MQKEFYERLSSNVVKNIFRFIREGCLLTVSSDSAQARDIDRKRFSGIEYLVPVSDAIGAAGNPLAVSDDKAADGLLYVLGGGPVQQGNRAREVLRHEKVIAVRGERHEHIIFTVIAADDDFDPRIDPVMAAHGQEPDVVGINRIIFFEQVA